MLPVEGGFANFVFKFCFVSLRNDIAIVLVKVFLRLILGLELITCRGCH